MRIASSFVPAACTASAASAAPPTYTHMLVVHSGSDKPRLREAGYPGNRFHWRIHADPLYYADFSLPLDYDLYLCPFHHANINTYVLFHKVVQHYFTSDSDFPLPFWLKIVCSAFDKFIIFTYGLNLACHEEKKTKLKSRVQSW